MADEKVGNGDVKEDKRKNPHKIAYVPPSQELRESLLKDASVEEIIIPERKTKAGVKPEEKVLLARKRPGILGLYNNDEKAMLYYSSMMAHAQMALYAAKHSEDKIAARAVKKAEKKVAKMSDAELDALIALAAERKAKKDAAANTAPEAPKQ